MSKKLLMKGNEAMGRAAIEAGCRYFFGYPITPQNELPEYMSKELPLVGGVFIQAESEVAAINMVYGAAGAGARVMTSSSSPGIALKQEGISYIAASRLPAVIIDVMRGGPGLGGIQPSQSDYFMLTRGGGNGDYRCIVFAPGNVQEAVHMIMEAFDLADLYRTPVMIAADGIIGQMMEPVEFSYKSKYRLEEKSWATVGTKEKRKPNIINSLLLKPQELYEHNLKLDEVYTEIRAKHQDAELYKTDDAELIVVAYGTMARICKSAIDSMRDEGKKIGMLRPKTLYPFPEIYFDKVEPKAFISIEMSLGQMVDDVKIAVNGKSPVYFYGKTGGIIPSTEDVETELNRIYGGL